MTKNFATHSNPSAHQSMINATIRNVIKAIDAAAGPLGMDSYAGIIDFIC